MSTASIFSVQFSPGLECSSYPTEPELLTSTAAHPHCPRGREPCFYLSLNPPKEPRLPNMQYSMNSMWIECTNVNPRAHDSLLLFQVEEKTSPTVSSRWPDDPGKVPCLGWDDCEVLQDLILGLEPSVPIIMNTRTTINHQHVLRTYYVPNTTSECFI